MMSAQQKGPVYRARPDLEGNRVAAERTEDPKVLRLVPPRRAVRWAGFNAVAARRVTA